MGVPSQFGDNHSQGTPEVPPGIPDITSSIAVGQGSFQPLLFLQKSDYYQPFSVSAFILSGFIGLVLGSILSPAKLELHVSHPSSEQLCPVSLALNCLSFSLSPSLNRKAMTLCHQPLTYKIHWLVLESYIKKCLQRIGRYNTGNPRWQLRSAPDPYSCYDHCFDLYDHKEQ